jgi:hypothetical protein
MLINHCRSVALLKAAVLSMKVSIKRVICSKDLNMIMSVTEGHGKSLKEIWYGSLELSHLGAVRNQWWNAGNEVMRLAFALDVENLLINLATTNL